MVLLARAPAESCKRWEISSMSLGSMVVIMYLQFGYGNNKLSPCLRVRPQRLHNGLGEIPGQYQHEVRTSLVNGCSSQNGNVMPGREKVLLERTVFGNKINDIRSDVEMIHQCCCFGRRAE